MPSSDHDADLVHCLNYTDPEFHSELTHLLAEDLSQDTELQAQVQEILNRVRSEGDRALLEYTKRFDHRNIKHIRETCVTAEQIDAAIKTVPTATLEALTQAAERIRVFHRHQQLSSWSFEDEWGNQLGQRIQAIGTVGIYVPGGKAAYPSSMLMNAIPAKVAGVSRIIATVPMPNDQLNPLVLAAAKIAGVDQLYGIGGAQAIAALAYGTETIPRVDKIVGPGNAYVATAKRFVFGEVGIDMIAGPSEILVVTDAKCDAETVAWDLLSQAEHDEAARVICISTDASFLAKLKHLLFRLLSDLPRAKIIRQALARTSALIEVPNMDCAIELCNLIAPEHLELQAEESITREQEFKHAGAIFIGRSSSESLGDYCAGPNHVLPTSATARFASPLGVYDFVTRTSLIRCSEQGAQQLAPMAAQIARAEGLEAHARAAEARCPRKLVDDQ